MPEILRTPNSTLIGRLLPHLLILVGGGFSPRAWVQKQMAKAALVSPLLEIMWFDEKYRLARKNDFSCSLVRSKWRSQLREGSK